MSAKQTAAVRQLLGVLAEERGENRIDVGALIYVGMLIGLIYFYISGSSIHWFWHDLLMLVSAFRL